MIRLFLPSDLSKYSYRCTHVNRSQLTTGHLCVWVLLEVSIQDGVTDLVTDLVCADSKRTTMKQT